MNEEWVNKLQEFFRAKIKLYPNLVDNILFWNKHEQLRKFFKGEKAYFYFKGKKYKIWVDKTIKYKYEKQRS